MRVLSLVFDDTIVNPPLFDPLHCDKTTYCCYFVKERGKNTRKKNALKNKQKQNRERHGTRQYSTSDHGKKTCTYLFKTANTKLTSISDEGIFSHC